jgi:hypothetical protein
MLNNATPLGRYQVFVNGSACGVPDVHASGWVEVVNPAAVNWPQYTIRNAPAAMTVPAGKQFTIPFTTAVTNRAAGLPMIMKCGIGCPNNRDALGQSIIQFASYNYLFITNASQTFTASLSVLRDAPTGVYAVSFTFQAGAQAITKTVQITVTRPRLNVAIQPNATVSLLPGASAQRTVTVSLVDGGFARVQWEEAALPPGMDIMTPMPGGGEECLFLMSPLFELGDGADNTTATALIDFRSRWYAPAGTYSLPLGCSIENDPAGRVVRNITVEIKPQFKMSIEPGPGGINLQNFLRIGVTNQAIHPSDYRLKFTMESDLPATLRTTQVMVRASGYATGDISYSALFQRSSSYYANRDYKVRVTATSPDYPAWPPITCAYTVFKGVKLETLTINTPLNPVIPPIPPGDFEREGREIPIPPPPPSP